MSDPLAGARETWLAPAKVNLWLEILGRRDDGYHWIDTALMAIDLADRIVIERGPGPGIACRVEGRYAAAVPEGEENLAARAARSISERTGHDPRVSISIEKRIPVGAGLGGGSSDAAVVLLALARRYAVPDPEHTLVDLAAELGADVPFFLVGGVQRAEGIGDELTLVDPPAERWGIVVVPGVDVSTRWAYRAWDEVRAGRLDRPPSPVAETELPADWRERSNALEPVVVDRHPEVDRALELLAAGPAVVTRMTGTGSAAFALYASREDRGVAFDRLQPAIGSMRARPFEAVPHGARLVAEEVPGS